jgi:hypothetical protein
MRVNGQPRLLVDGKPFLILGLQWDCDSCFSPEEMNPLFPHAVRMGANTAALPTYWREIEPEPGQFDFRMIDERLEQARIHDLRLVLLWFATWKNGSPAYAPDYIRDDPKTYPRALDRHGQPTVSLSPTFQSTWQRDCDALIAMMKYLREVDTDHRVIMVQIENEPGYVGTDRCYQPQSTELFEAGRWRDQWGVMAEEIFSACQIADYIERLAAEAKAVYPIPLYINVALGYSKPSMMGVPGTDYFGGGFVPRVIDFASKKFEHIDVIAPDPYRHAYRDFHETCQQYTINGNPLFIAEHSSSQTGRAERNVFYAIGDYGAIGFDPWAIDSPYPERYGPPLVDRIGGEWAEQAYWLRDSYVAIGKAMQQIVEAQGTENIFTFVQEMGETETGWETDGCDIVIKYHDRHHAARGMIIRRSETEFLVIGLGFNAHFRHPRPDGRPVRIIQDEWGRFDGNTWIPIHPFRLRRQVLETVDKPIVMLEPGVARLFVDLTADLT